MKRCAACGLDRPVARFEPGRRICRDCRNARNRGRKTYTTAGHRRWTYGIDQSAFDQLLLHQEGRCPVCDGLLTRPVIDHDHRSGTVRGLLCGPCNRGLGHFQDDPGLCEQAALYLR